MVNNKTKGEAFWGGVLILTVILGVIALIAISLSSCKKKDTTASEGAVVVANKAYIDSLKAQLVVKDSTISVLKVQDKASEEKQANISKSFKPVYEKINNDTGIVTQLNYTKVLLTEHNGWPLKRD
jgi:hypothetical protein